MAHQMPNRFDVFALGRLNADGNAHHPAPFELRRRQIALSRAVDALDPAERVAVQFLAAESRRLVADAHRLQYHWGEHFPAWRGPHLLAQPAGVVDVATQARLKTRDAFGADQAPQFQRPEAATERDAPVAVVLHPPVGGRLQVARISRHDANEVLRVADIIE